MGLGECSSHGSVGPTVRKPRQDGSWDMSQPSPSGQVNAGPHQHQDVSLHMSAGQVTCRLTVCCGIPCRLCTAQNPRLNKAASPNGISSWLITRDCDSLSLSPGTQAWDAVGKGQTEVQTAWESKEGLDPAVGGLLFLAKRHVFSTWASPLWKQAHNYTAKRSQTRALPRCAPSQPAGRELRPRSLVAGPRGASSRLRHPAPQSTPAHLHPGLQAPSTLEGNPSRKTGVCSFAQDSGLNSGPWEERSFLENASKTLMPEKSAKSHHPVGLPC